MPDSKELLRTRKDPRFGVSIDNFDLVKIYKDVMWTIAALSDNASNLDEFLNRVHAERSLGNFISQNRNLSMSTNSSAMCFKFLDGTRWVYFEITKDENGSSAIQLIPSEVSLLQLVSIRLF